MSGLVFDPQHQPSSSSSASLGLTAVAATLTPLQEYPAGVWEGQGGRRAERKRCSAYVLCTVTPAASGGVGGCRMREAKRPKHKVKSGRENVNKNTASRALSIGRYPYSIRTFPTRLIVRSLILLSV